MAEQGRLQTRTSLFVLSAYAGSSFLLAASCSGPVIPRDATQVGISTTEPVATIDLRFLSVAVDSSEVLGGEWWTDDAQAMSGVAEAPVAPFDFTRPRLARLAQELAPAFLRIGATVDLCGASVFQ